MQNINVIFGTSIKVDFPNVHLLNNMYYENKPFELVFVTSMQCKAMTMSTRYETVPVPMRNVQSGNIQVRKPQHRLSTCASN